MQSLPGLINKFQSRNRRVCAERTGQCLASSRIVDDLLGPDLVLEGRFYVGVDKKLYARRKAISSDVERRDE